MGNYIMKKILLSLCLALSFGSCSNAVEQTQQPIVASKVFDINTPPLSTMIIEKIIEVDFDGNQIKDRIYIAYSEQKNILNAYWVNDKGILALEEFDLPSQNHYFFANLDEDSEPEVVSIRGYEDGSDAFIADIDFRTKTLKPFFYFNPIVRHEDQFYWAYAWDIDSLILDKNKQLLFSEYPNIIVDREFLMRDGQVNMPAIVFMPNDSFEIDSSVITLHNTHYASIRNIEAFSMGSQ